MNTMHKYSDELIGEIVETKEGINVNDLFSDNAVYPLQSQPNNTPYKAGSIIRGVIKKDQVAPFELLASSNSIHSILYKIASKHNLNPLFTTKVMNEVSEILASPGLNDPTLEDMTGWAFCTIDDAGTRDLDQALFIEQEKNQYRVYYALADAAYYVRPGTHLFDEALKRGSSYYLPGLMIPMLPRPLCEGLISLNEKELRRAMIFELHLDSTGACFKTRIFRARIKSRAKLSFEQVQAFLDSHESHFNDDPALGKSLKLLQKVGELRLRLADERNIVRYRRHEVHVELGPDGCRYNILDRLRNNVEQYNEQLSLLCNVEGARFLNKDDTDDDHIQPIFRVHPSPPKTQITAFEQLLKSLIQIHQLDSALWGWRQSGQKTLADYLKNLPVTGVLSRIAQAIHRQAIMINVRSVFSDQAAQHYGVGAEVYARFSAPMREIVGIFLHKETAEKQLSTPPIALKIDDDELREKIIKTANRSKTLQRKITHEGNILVLNQMFQDDLQDNRKQRPSHQGTIIGMDKRKLYILLDYPKIDVKVYITHLEADLSLSLDTSDEKVVLYRKDSNEAFVKLGDPISLYVKEKDKDRDRWVLLLNTHS